MSKFRCTCEHIISDNEVPNEVTGWLLSDKSGDYFFKKIQEIVDECASFQAKNDLSGFKNKYFDAVYPDNESAGGMVHDILTSYFFALTLKTMECENCGNLWVQRQPDENYYLEYSPQGEPSERKALLRFNATRDIEGIFKP